MYLASQNSEKFFQGMLIETHCQKSEEFSEIYEFGQKSEEFFREFCVKY